MSRSQSSGVNSSISFPSQHRAHPSVGGGGGDVGLFTKPRSPDISPQPTHPNPIPFSTPSVHPEETEWVGLERERQILIEERSVWNSFPSPSFLISWESDPPLQITTHNHGPQPFQQARTAPSGTARSKSRQRNPYLLLRDLPPLASLP